MKFCVECGTKLEEKFLEGEGMIPYCDTCKQHRFPIFNTAVSMVVLNEAGDKSLLIKQYGRDFYILVAGYVNKGESAENAVSREVKEEVGLDVTRCLFNKSEYFERSNTLMLNFVCYVKDECLDGMTEEVDHAEWFTIEEARKNIKEDSLAQRFLEHFVVNKKE
jgi:NAD+ diphosphatase